MIFAYHEYQVRPTSGRSDDILYRPMVPIRVTGPGGRQVVLGLIDTGSDVTVLPSFILPIIGATYLATEPGRFRGIGGQTVTARYSEVELALDHHEGLYRWTTPIAFLDGLDTAIFGHAGFLDYFHARFDSERHQLTLKPNKHFSGEART